ncbi:hypothetical protein CH54_3810 [Yersinia rochesterensis]|uniref:Uncharacterized protein n=1 Tax=Yersinia rochesterensis TaxID=1604335 RepID=A0ABN4FIR7_9GAMM|nr:hypothetical protein [Yersinia rochesterensis]AJI86154.1 hypothetical protein AW19_1975 [Yersinia frederiksenii Y225]AJJ37271.1 hypothetical protein CH54_3810 [Yersinia rochesterensis]
MTQKWNITVETQSGEIYTGAMTRQQPEIVNGFVAIATEEGEWIYLKPDEVKKMHFVPVVDKPTDKPVDAVPEVESPKSEESEPEQEEQSL